MHRLLRSLLLAAVALSLALAPCTPAKASAGSRCSMGDCEEVQIGRNLPCCCAAPTAPAPADGSTALGGADAGKGGVQKNLTRSTGTPLASASMPASRIEFAEARVAGASDLFLLNAVFRI